ncbi:hypothetical protein [Streptomyces sp. NPDC048644]|uniref:hypothetical protein n=1 Tax=Streptomyces sp. NPDC048644 TaxID=3365582 RepID=UPI00372418F3
MSFIARMSERHTTKLSWIVVLGAAASVFVGDPLWRWVAGLGPGGRQWVRGTGAAAVGCVAFLALACLVPGRNGRLFGSLGMAGDRRMWVEENPAVWGAIGIGLALGALALRQLAPRRATGRRRRPGSAED